MRTKPRKTPSSIRAADCSLLSMTPLWQKSRCKSIRRSFRLGTEPEADRYLGVQPRAAVAIADAEGCAGYGGRSGNLARLAGAGQGEADALRLAHALEGQGARGAIAVRAGLLRALCGEDGLGVRRRADTFVPGQHAVLVAVPDAGACQVDLHAAEIGRASWRERECKY